MPWTVETLGDIVDDEIAALPTGVEQIGLERLREPHVKHLEGKLWELRASAAEGIARGIYVTAIGRRVVILHVFVKKSQKTPSPALETARRRLRQMER